MRRVRLDTLTIEQIPEPAPAEGEFLIRPAAIGVTLPVVRMSRRGGPGVLGGEVAGTVIGLGPGVTGYALGDQVVTLPFTGSYQDVVVAPAAVTSPIPPGAAVTAVALVRSGHVALAALDSLAAGESVLITAAASGVGHLAVQLARARASSGGGTIAAPDLLAGAKTVTGLAMRHFAATHPNLYATHERELWKLAESGQLRPAIHAELPLTDAARAHDILESRQNLGKVVLRP
ncbi:quinone oxidoreductase family protein [Symbioplanes lichenis]|uniref:quinone oxidoreductase family protein n=1 Tax=Symbioplanes lichenis TaxID=1629072 RepID=UPI002739A936|nr:zinc-binding dehydrogenase [Actinoplanes lichenis]